MSSKLSFPPSSPFHTDLKKRVDAYFAEQQLSKAANGAMMAKSLFWFAFAWGSWALCFVVPPSFPLLFALFCVQGFGFACIGFNIGHDAIHGSYSENPRVNKALSWCFDVMGAASPTWRVSHNVVHHTYTNIPGVDNDLEPGFWMVFYPQKTRAWHRYQHWFAWFLYCFVGAVWMYVKDFDQMANKDPLTGKGLTKKELFQLFAGKALHIALLVAAPLVFIDAPIWQILLCYAGLLAAAGFTLSIVFQLAHCMEGCVFPRVPHGEKPKMPEAWAEHQMRTTANFGRSRLATFICGGLDHQIEHHLFPRICHVHYPKLAPIVQACAAEHGLPYIHNGSFFEAVVVHARTLKRLGRGEGLETFESPLSPVAEVAPAE